MATKTDKLTLDLMNEVKKRKTEIAKAERPNWRTNCSFSYGEGDSKSVNIHVMQDVRQLVSIVAFLRAREQYYDLAAKELGVDAPSFKWSGFSVSDWVEDIKMRVNKIQIASKKTSLESLETRLNKIVSPALREEMELQAIRDELG